MLGRLLWFEFKCLSLSFTSQRQIGKHDKFEQFLSFVAVQLTFRIAIIFDVKNITEN